MWPLNSGGNQDAQIHLAEGGPGSNGMSVKCDGNANQLPVLGKNGATLCGPHLIVPREPGRVGVGRRPSVNALAVEGDASKTATPAPTSRRSAARSFPPRSPTWAPRTRI